MSSPLHRPVQFTGGEPGVVLTSQGETLALSSGEVNGGAGGAIGSPLPVFVRLRPVERLGFVQRLVALGVGVMAMGLLVVAGGINPDPRGVGTHEQLGMAPCTFMAVFGLPCPSCGYTTSFSLFAHFRWAGSAYNQPMGFLLAVMCAMAGWGAVYVACTGKPLHRLFARYVTGRTVLGVTIFLVLAWGWKMGEVKGLW